MNQDAAYHRLAYKIFAEFTGTIAVPAVLATLLGKWLDDCVLFISQEGLGKIDFGLWHDILLLRREAMYGNLNPKLQLEALIAKKR